MGAVSGAFKLVLASSGAGGAPSVPRRFSLDRSAIRVVPYSINQSLDECVSLFVQFWEAGFGDGPANVHCSAIAGALHQAAQGGVTGLGYISPRVGLFGLGSYVVESKRQLCFGNPSLHKRVKLFNGRPQVIIGNAG